jgi:hypothetical protein
MALDENQPLVSIHLEEDASDEEEPEPLKQLGQPGTPLEEYKPEVHGVTKHLDKEIRRAIKTLQRRATEPPSGRGSVKEGQLLKRRSKIDSWKNSWVKLDPATGKLSYSKSASVSSPVQVKTFPLNGLNKLI